MANKILIALAFSLGILFIPRVVFASTYYVSTIGSDTNPGTQAQPWLTVQKAQGVLKAGDTVYLRTGTYQGNFRPVNSGLPGSPITIASYPGESVTITHNPSQEENVINFGYGRSYLIVDGITLDGNWTGGWVEGYNNGGYNIVRNVTGINCMKTRSGIYISSGGHWKIQNNNLSHGDPIHSGTSGSDAITIRNSNYNLIEGNHITNSEHSTILAGGSDNVIRNNTLSNIYNQVVNSGAATGDKRILWENNTMAGSTSAPQDGGRAQGIQLNSQQTIIRHNIIYNTYSPGISLESYLTDSEAADVNGDRIYNNTIFGSQDGGMGVYRFEAGSVQSNNVWKNNIARMNVYSHSSSNPQQLYFADDASGATDYNYVIGANIFLYNDFSTTTTGANVIGATCTTCPNIVHNLAWWQINFSSNITNNLETDPRFVNENGYNFNLTASSPLIDAGTNLTITVGAGSGTQLTVSDAKYFSDGFGVVSADWIKIGHSDPVQISSIDYPNNIITLASSSVWNDGDPVNLYKDSSGNVVLAGNFPDIGAYEFVSGGTPTPTIQPTASPILTPTPTPKPGDANGDGQVNETDFTIWLSHFGQAISGITNGDFNGDGHVDGIDYTIWLNNYGK